MSTLKNLHGLLNMIQTNSKHLERLELGFAGRGAKFDLWTQSGLVFPSLQTLSLSYVYFTAIAL